MDNDTLGRPWHCHHGRTAISWPEDRAWWSLVEWTKRSGKC